ncbi:MAG: ABC transporter ATP-binding protein [Verrucomicrobiota bacterium]
MPSTTPSIDIKEMRVDYEDFTAVKGLNLSIPEGEVFGLVGPNGAGKTSTFSVLATLLEPTYGEVYLCGVDIRESPVEARKLFGYMPDMAPAPTDLKVGEFLELYAAAYGLEGAEKRERITECLQLVELSSKRNVFCKTLSRGMTQRVVLAKALLHRPRVLLLDEPASGMDPPSRVALRKIIQNLAKEGVTTLISSHILLELSGFCTTIGIFNQGELLDSGSPCEIIERMGHPEESRTLKISLLEPSPKLIEFLEENPEIEEVDEEGSVLVCRYAGSPEQQVELLAEMTAKGFPVRSFEEYAQSIEDIVMKLHQEDNS